ncbi:MAG: hypothetical protein U1D55_17615 [Phycisphaerae bacterium]
MGSDDREVRPIEPAKPVATVARAANDAATAPLRAAPQAPSSAPAAARRWASTRYFVCLAVLAGAAIAMQASASWLSVYFRKEAVPLRKPLYLIDLTKLAPTYVPHPVPVPTLSEDTIQTLGTREFVNLRLVDATVARTDPTSLADIFITYFTGKPDMVPHRPEECIVASGLTLNSSMLVAVNVPGVGAPRDQIPISSLLFDLPGNDPRKFNVLYFFRVNGRYCTTRDEVRFAQANIFDRYAYYAKVEIRFSSYDMTQFAGRDVSGAAAERLLRRLWPILMTEHLPDWDKLKSGAKAPAAAEG